MNHQDMFDLLVEERGPYCELCNWRRATQKHHCIVKQKRGHPEYDVKINLELTCDECHIWGDGYINSYEHKCGFWKRQVERGLDIGGWYDSLPLKKKEHFE